MSREFLQHVFFEYLTQIIKKHLLNYNTLKNSNLYKALPLVFFLAVMMIFSSCSYKSRNTLFHTAKPVNVDSIKDVYVLQPGSGPEQKVHIINVDDQLTIRNLQNPNLISGLSSGMAFASTALLYRVDVDSTVALPVIGRVNLVGLTLLQAEKRLTELYKMPPLMLRDPVINIAVANARVTVLGEANRQGNFLLTKERTSLVELLGEASGLNTRANKRTIQIIRGNPKNPEVIYVNMRNINSLASDKLILQNGDIIYIQPNRFALGLDQLQQVLPYVTALTLLINTALLIDRITSN